jgi:hypothetical protein
MTGWWFAPILTDFRLKRILVLGRPLCCRIGAKRVAVAAEAAAGGAAAGGRWAVGGGRRRS